jgi:hypothetical protein
MHGSVPPAKFARCTAKTFASLIYIRERKGKRRDRVEEQRDTTSDVEQLQLLCAPQLCAQLAIPPCLEHTTRSQGAASTSRNKANRNANAIMNLSTRKQSTVGTGRNFKSAGHLSRPGSRLCQVVTVFRRVTEASATGRSATLRAQSPSAEAPLGPVAKRDLCRP